MNLRSLFLPTLFILIISVILGFANNFLNPNRVVLSNERPTAQIIEDSTLEGASPEKISQPIVLGKEQLKKLILDGTAIVIDARTPDEFLSGHIIGAINIPFELLIDYIQQVDELPRDKWLVCYCDGPPCDKGKLLADELFKMDFKQVAYYDAGLDDWKTTEELEQ